MDQEVSEELIMCGTMLDLIKPDLVDLAKDGDGRKKWVLPAASYILCLHAMQHISLDREPIRVYIKL